MPNWCENRLTVNCEPSRLNEIKSKLIRYNDESNPILDFNLLIPMPEELDIVSGGFGERTKIMLEMPQDLPLTEDFIARHIAAYDTNDMCYLHLSLLSQQEQWQVKDFVQWLDEHPDKQAKYQYDLPLGRQYLNNIAKYGASDWYHWCIKNWGTKWNAEMLDDSILEGQKHSLECFFNTAWCPPEEWFHSLCTAFKDCELKLYFYEPGMCFAGFFESHADNYISYYVQGQNKVDAFAQEYIYI
ncbi:hypothetical protein A6046_01090 [[Haemophilus] ducreyi]|uniref:YubB ferredoxin-like domain-containing protein n=2 Tax=Haemophilus ducreyi TaxID=730 RepID=Q7VMQ7_HAEDU|nr:hypothetical protein [[Haemophilus] ducreyi]AAP95799.1 hypothetical protein HD_0915 [[Haemophilus] ducreyi 35000HP]AKO30841.1 hypothetical protein RY60_03615 [[Haemophilus] ducreyi]AKO32279.1 hypothetical protein RZ57_03620 [[Haemophilus] ducreyi]AKO33733.1 hypothetical protein RZ58_03635 [[Haemophilus] ducreyi]AKO35181.1 hypothetical protein RZ59_03600 [[Haemophilus] ducreyi]